VTRSDIACAAQHSSNKAECRQSAQVRRYYGARSLRQTKRHDVPANRQRTVQLLLDRCERAASVVVAAGTAAVNLV
jgi:hypothetical protein